MKPVICFYENTKYIWSLNYQIISCTDDPFVFLQKIEREYFKNLKILKINFDAFEKTGDSSKIDVFILNDYQIVSESELNLLLNSNQNVNQLVYTPTVSQSEFIKNVESIKKDIAAGRFYQINYTAGLKASVSSEFSSLNYFKTLSQKIKCDYRAFLPLNDSDIICLSPELFLQKKNNVVKTQPIKGTLVQGDSLESLQQSKKEDAELSMIVDLLRNDLNTLNCTEFNSYSKVNFHRKIMELGYTSHTYSEIEMQTSKKLPEILQRTFPGGSISGCPKKESLLKIKEIENYTRGFYTGSIGWWQEDQFSLNIAIRSFLKKNNEIYYFTGCGVVHDSEPEKEWNEFLTKSSFLKLNLNQSGVLDTLELTANGFTYLIEHIERTCLAQGTSVDTEIASQYHRIQTELLAKLDFTNATYKVRLVFPENLKAVQVTYEKIDPSEKEIVLQLKAWGNHPFTKYKFTDRMYWNLLLQKKTAEAHDLLIYNLHGFITETSIYNVFYKLGENFYTPPVSDGCLYGVLRQHLLNQGYIVIENKTYSLSERSLAVHELDAVKIYVGNSIRGIKKARVL